MRRKPHRSGGSLCGPLIVVLALVLSAPELGAKERRGANIKVKKIDGQVIEGELLAVRGNDLIILARSTSQEVAESLTEIKKIEIGKESEKVIGAIILGAASAVICAYAVPPHGEVGPTGERTVPSRTSQAIWGGIAGIGAGLLYVSERRNIGIAKADPESLAKIRARLRKRARDRS
jgi:hypothetical protein